MGSDTLTIQLSGVDGARVDADAVKIIEVSPALSAYDALGNLASVTDALGRTTQYMHDNLGRTIQQIAPDPDDYTASGGTNQGLTSPVTSYAYDAKGNLTATTDPLGYTTRTQYDGLDRPTVVTDALGRSPGDPQHSTVTAYDALGRVTAVTDPLGRTINYQYDNLGRKTAQLLPDPDGIGQDRPTTYYGYDPNGNLKYVTDPLGSAPGDSDHTTWYFYDALNRPTCVVDALANATYPMDGPAPSPSRRTAC
jgi:YD repeat-containing protein